MKLPNGDKAIVTDEKLFGYLLNEEHESQPVHADLFRMLLGITQDNANILRSALLTAAANEDAVPAGPSPFGDKFEITFSMTGPRKSYIIVSVWMLEHGMDVPRLITAFIE